MRLLVPLVAVIGVVALGGLAVATSNAPRRSAAERHLRTTLPSRPPVLRSPAFGPGDLRSDERSAPAPAGRRVPPWVVERLDDLAVPVDPAALWWGAWTGVAGAAVLGAVVGGPGLAVVALLGAAAVPVVVVVLGRGRRGRLVDHQLPAALDRMGRALRAGTSLRSTFGVVAVGAPVPLADELARVDAELGAGEPLAAVLVRWGDRCPTPGVRLLVAAATLGHEAGGAQARAIDGVAATLRERHAVHREGRALASQARASAAVVVLAPVGFAAFSAATDPEVLAFLLGTAPGLVCLVLALGLDLAAAVWMARITRSTG